MLGKSISKIIWLQEQTHRLVALQVQARRDAQEGNE
jgi:hypothetical protein